MFPVGDDRGPGTGAPIVTIALIILNVLAFFLELGQGSEGALQSFITAWGVVPRIHRGSRPATPDSTSVLVHAPHVDVHPRRLDASRRQHAVLVDLRRQRRAVDGFACVPFFSLSAALPRPGAVRVQRRITVPSLGASGAISGVLGGYLDFSTEPRSSAHARRHRLGARHRGPRVLDRDSAVQPFRIHCADDEGGASRTWRTSAGSLPAWSW